VSFFLFFSVLISFASFVSISHDHRPNLLFFIAPGTERNGEGVVPITRIISFAHADDRSLYPLPHSPFHSTLHGWWGLILAFSITH
jgi:hypothetical protein